MVGFAIYIVIDNGIGEIDAIMIDQHYQGRGYGRSAVIDLINLLKDEYQCKEVRLSHRKKNDIASKLYESLGFEIICRIVQLFLEYFQSWIILLTLLISERYINLSCEGDSFEARNHCVDERNFKFRKD
ncbi:ribosomal protein S18 acetylase RimI-like enzyme [Paenibacillus sp. OAS669]|nr:ribosomal protein S18 acetylase RimI-like enzyme [Paenibacillus sp. OAS669]